MKKFLHLSVLCWIPLSGSFFQGFYVGGGMGGALNAAKGSSSNLAVSSDGSFFLTVSERAKDLNLLRTRLYGELFVGWSQEFCLGPNVGARVGINASSYDTEQTRTQTSATPNAVRFTLLQSARERVRVRSVEYTFDGRVGWTLCDRFLFYALFGVALNEPRLTVSGDSVFTDTNVGVTNLRQEDRVSRERSRYRANFRWGAGLEARLTCCLGVNILYAYTDYGRIQQQATGQSRVLATQFLTQFVESSMRLHRHSLSAGLTHHF